MDYIWDHYCNRLGDQRGKVLQQTMSFSFYDILIEALFIYLFILGGDEMEKICPI